MSKSNDIYSNDYVAKLFDSIAPTYDKVNALTSLGFSKIWRKNFINTIAIKKDAKVLDLMCGMGECWPYIKKKSNNTAEIIGIDLSKEMIRIANKKYSNIVLSENIICNDAFAINYKENEYDHVVSGFGLKTLKLTHIEQLAFLLKKVLKPGGSFTFIEMSIPNHILVKWMFMIYLKNVIPFIGRMFLGNPENYRMLGTYTEKFIGIEKVAEIFAKVGLEVEIHAFTMGCTKVVSGRKPNLDIKIA